MSSNQETAEKDEGLDFTPDECKEKMDQVNGIIEKINNDALERKNSNSVHRDSIDKKRGSDLDVSPPKELTQHMSPSLVKSLSAEKPDITQD
jgi:hypothetical protein